MTKVLAFYLPQFHPIPENDKWWGVGFTEWTNVKKASPLFKNHNQPRIPYNNNYYLLNEKNTLMWQADMMHDYGVDGMCFYHYWFNGKQLLQTPLSILLKNPDINIPFCLSWANEPWTRTWDGGDKQVLMPQTYGDEPEWKIHFDYLINVFKDPRYILVEGKPMFVIYRAASIPNVSKMLSFLSQLAVENGFPGIHFVKMNTVFKDRNNIHGFDASLDFEPMHTIVYHLHFFSRCWRSILIRSQRLINYVFPIHKRPEDQVSYQYVWQCIIKRPLCEHNYAGAFVDWDNTPRRSERGLVMHGACPESFYHFFSQQYQRCCKNNVPFIFINAWNEWAEGTYLEPDVKYGYGYLEAIKRTKGL